MSTTALDRRAATAKATDGAAVPSPHPRRQTRKRLGPGRPIPYGWALGTLLLLAVWAAYQGPDSSTPAACPRPGPSPATAA